MHNREQNLTDPIAIGLRALAWTMAESERAQRMLSLTGITPEELRRRADDPALLAALLTFLEAHEPDLIACADATGIAPRSLVQARAALDS